MAPNYASITEVPGTGMTSENVTMLSTRYSIALPFCEGSDILEVACGTGPGLGLLAAQARRVVGGDVTQEFVAIASRHYGDRVCLTCLDAQSLPFRQAAFDVVILHEAIYFLPDAERSLLECKRVLRAGGVLLLSSVNREWSGFNPAPLSTRYFSSRELATLLQEYGFTVELFASHPEHVTSATSRVLLLLRQAATRFHLIPRTMRGKAVLKRLFFGRLSSAPQELRREEMVSLPVSPLQPTEQSSTFKILYAVARLPEAA